MIKNIVFDMGMVLLDYDPMLPCMRHAKDAEKAKAVYEAIFLDPEWAQLTDTGILTEAEYLPLVQARLQTPELKQLAADVLADWPLDGLCPKSGMNRVVENLLDRGFRLYVLSNVGFRFHEFSYKIRQMNRFSGVLISAEEHVIKPDPAIYRRLCEKFDLVAEECLFVDDVEKNIIGAQSVGMQGYCFADGDVNRLYDALNALEAPGADAPCA